MVVSKDGFERCMALSGHEHYLDHLLTMSLNDAGKRRVDGWLKEVGLIDKCRVGVVAVHDYDESRTNAYAKVIVRDSGSFIHEELYTSFPSDHFKAKVLLVCG